VVSQRVALVGLDGFSPLWLDRLLGQGKLPHLAAVARRGTTVALRSTLPATTPVAWATVATGCSPAVTGIDANLLHRPGARLDRRLGCYAHRCQAEPLWATASRSGKRSYVVKFPVSYPSSTATFRLDGAAGWAGLKCLHELSSAAAADIQAPAALPASPAGTGGPPLYAAAEPWRGDADDAASAAPATPATPATPAIGGEDLLWRGRWRLDNLWGGPPLVLYVSVLGSPAASSIPSIPSIPSMSPIPFIPSASSGYRSVAIADAPDWDRLLVRLAPGEWSAPLAVRGVGRRGEADHAFRIKVLECEGDPLRLRLYHTVVHERSGHSEPRETWERHLAAAGPIEEQTDPFVFFGGGIDLATQLELFRLNAEWLKRISVALLTGEPFDLFMIQLHFTDWAHHMLEGALDPRHPDFRADAAGRYEDVMVGVYRLADEVVGEIRQALGPEDDLIVLGDHGQDLHHTTLHVNEWLAGEGLLHWLGEGDEVDWERTMAYAAGNFVYLNLEGREPTGIVPAGAAEALAARLTAGLLSIEDRERRARPILTAGVKEAFAPLGAHGAGVGDVVFVCRSGYQSRNSRGPLLAPTRLFREFTSGHDHFWPLDPRIETRLLAAGPSFREGYRHPRPAQLADVAPTVCAALGIEPSPQCEGSPLPGLLRPALEPCPRRQEGAEIPEITGRAATPLASPRPS
jgi:predicted AlkP superfamily phosphohydrolase/phosphomutase